MIVKATSKIIGANKKSRGDMVSSVLSEEESCTDCTKNFSHNSNEAEEKEAVKTWEVGKKVGLVDCGNESVVVEKLRELDCGVENHKYSLFGWFCSFKVFCFYGLAS